jgi:glycosyltransferase involved in cell wall biosynthesis
MKICFIGDAGHVNLLSWVECLINKRNHEIDIITFNQPCESISGIKVHLLPTPLINTKVRYLLAIPRVKAKVSIIKPDILIGYRINSYGLMAAMTGFHPLVLVAQGTDLFYPVDSNMQSVFLRYAVRKADLLQTWATHMGNKLIEYGADKNKMIVLPKGVDTDIFRPLYKQRTDESFTLISTRQLRKTYNHDQVLNALPTVLEKIPHLQYLICGEGEYRSELEKLCTKLGIENHVRFIGRVKHNMLPNYIGSSDIYISMQSTDGVSSSLLEAMACGVFPIVTNIEANRMWVKDGMNGFLVPVNDQISLAKKIISAYENRRLRQEAVSKNITLIAEKASMAHNMTQIEKVYIGLIENFKNGRD